MQRLYEGMFLVDAGRAGGGGGSEETVNHIKGLLDRSGAQLVTLKRWDERKLAYEVEGHKRGVYYIAYFRADGGKLAGLERDCQLSETVLRALIVRKDEKFTEEQARNVKTIAELREEENRRERERQAAGEAKGRGEDIEPVPVSELANQF